MTLLYKYLKREYFTESEEVDCKEFYPPSTFMTPSKQGLPDIMEEPDILKLKEKLNSISNPYYIAPYDSLQLYHYEVQYPLTILYITLFLREQTLL